MNDPDRRQTSDGFDHDAMFADIVAHWDEDAAEPKPVERTHDAGSDQVVDAPGDQVVDAPGDQVVDAPGDQVVDAPGHQVVDAPGHEPGLDGPGHEPVPDHRADGGPTAQPPAGHHHFHSDFHTDPPPVLPTPSEPLAIPAPAAWRAHEVDDHEEHFEPPPLAPLPVGDLQFWAIIAGMGGGPLLLLYLVLFNREAGGYWMLSAIAMSVGGFALLVSRLPHDREDDGDDGARL